MRFWLWFIRSECILLTNIVLCSLETSWLAQSEYKINSRNTSFRKAHPDKETPCHINLTFCSISGGCTRWLSHQWRHLFSFPYLSCCMCLWQCLWVFLLSSHFALRFTGDLPFAARAANERKAQVKGRSSPDLHWSCASVLLWSQRGLGIVFLGSLGWNSLRVNGECILHDQSVSFAYFQVLCWGLCLDKMLSAAVHWGRIFGKCFVKCSEWTRPALHGRKISKWSFRWFEMISFRDLNLISPLPICDVCLENKLWI